MSLPAKILKAGTKSSKKGESQPLSGKGEAKQTRPKGTRQRGPSTGPGRTLSLAKGQKGGATRRCRSLKQSKAGE